MLDFVRIGPKHGEHKGADCIRQHVQAADLLPDQSLPLLKRRWELSREEALRLWAKKRQQGWQVCEPQWALAPERQPWDGSVASDIGKSVSPA